MDPGPHNGVEPGGVGKEQVGIQVEDLTSLDCAEEPRKVRGSPGSTCTRRRPCRRGVLVFSSNCTDLSPHHDNHKHHDQHTESWRGRWPWVALPCAHQVAAKAADAVKCLNSFLREFKCALFVFARMQSVCVCCVVIFASECKVWLFVVPFSHLIKTQALLRSHVLSELRGAQAPPNWMCDARSACPDDGPPLFF